MNCAPTLFLLPRLSTTDLPDLSTMLLALLVIWAVTFFLRGFPFLALKTVKNSPTMNFLGKTMPLGVMIILLVFAISDPNFSSPKALAPSGLALLLTGVLHWKWANALISIGSGILSFALLSYLF